MIDQEHHKGLPEGNPTNTLGDEPPTKLNKPKALRSTSNLGIPTLGGVLIPRA